MIDSFLTVDLYRNVGCFQTVPILFSSNPKIILQLTECTVDQLTWISALANQHKEIVKAYPALFVQMINMVRKPEIITVKKTNLIDALVLATKAHQAYKFDVSLETLMSQVEAFKDCSLVEMTLLINL